MAAKSLLLSLKVVGLRGGLSPLSAETHKRSAVLGAVVVQQQSPYLLHGAAAIHRGEGVGMGNPSLEGGKSN